MAIAFALITQLLTPVHDAVEWLAGGPAPAAASTPAHQAFRGEEADGTDPHEEAAPASVRVRSRVHTRANTAPRALRSWGGPMRAPQRPLRVVRADEQRHVASAGRMVISGRMADVCAELDRLAALEVPFERAANA